MSTQGELIPVILPVIKAFEELGIQYYIGGSVASSAYGFTRTTLDVDVVTNLHRHQIKPLMQKLTPEYFIDDQMILHSIQYKTSFNIVHLQTMLKIDVFILQEKPFPLEAFNRKRKDTLEDSPDAVQIYLATPEDVILHKLEWYKMGNMVSERQWGDILGVLKVQKNHLDKQYLLKWAKEISVFDLLQKALKEAE